MRLFIGLCIFVFALDLSADQLKYTDSVEIDVKDPSDIEKVSTGFSKSANLFWLFKEVGDWSNDKIDFSIHLLNPNGFSQSRIISQEVELAESCYLIKPDEASDYLVAVHCEVKDSAANNNAVNKIFYADLRSDYNFKTLILPDQEYFQIRIKADLADPTKMLLFERAQEEIENFQASSHYTRPVVADRTTGAIEQINVPTTVPVGSSALFLDDLVYFYSESTNDHVLYKINIGLKGYELISLPPLDTQCNSSFMDLSYIKGTDQFYLRTTGEDPTSGRDSYDCTNIYDLDGSLKYSYKFKFIYKANSEFVVSLRELKVLKDYIITTKEYYSRTPLLEVLNYKTNQTVFTQVLDDDYFNEYAERQLVCYLPIELVGEIMECRNLVTNQVFQIIPGSAYILDTDLLSVDTGEELTSFYDSEGGLLFEDAFKASGQYLNQHNWFSANYLLPFKTAIRVLSKEDLSDPQVPKYKLVIQTANWQ